LAIYQLYLSWLQFLFGDEYDPDYVRRDALRPSAAAGRGELSGWLPRPNHERIPLACLQISCPINSARSEVSPHAAPPERDPHPQSIELNSNISIVNGEAGRSACAVLIDSLECFDVDADRPGADQ
jgi:hypothetical protein